MTHLDLLAVKMDLLKIGDPASDVAYRVIERIQAVESLERRPWHPKHRPGPVWDAGHESGYREAIRDVLELVRAAE